jgi:sugar phosphate isomerase/epimerase
VVRDIQAHHGATPAKPHVGYCTNVHPGEGLEAIERVLAEDVARVHRAFAPDRPFGLGLRLGHEAATRLWSAPAELERFRGLLESLDMYVFTVNAFPYGDFAAATVKADVYRPDWLTGARQDYTMRVAEVASRLPGPDHRTISTVAGGYKASADDSGNRALMAERLLDTAVALARLADRTGVHVRLCLEPEPFTTLETTEDACDFFERHLFADHKRAGEARAHLGLCWDACHQAVVFEAPSAILARLDAAGVTIGKVQVSSALEVTRPADPDARAALLAFAEPRYLHQTFARTPSGRILRALDLPAVPADAPEWVTAEAWRCHFHVPIDWAGDARLGTTRAHWVEVVERLSARAPHFEVETYTWGVLPQARLDTLAAEGLVPGIVGELRALTGVLDEAAR